MRIAIVRLKNIYYGEYMRPLIIFAFLMVSNKNAYSNIVFYVIA